MNFTLFIIVLFATQLLCLYLSSRVSKKIKNQDDYFLAGKSLKFFPLMMTLVASQIGGGMILGATEEAYQYGWYVLLYPLGTCLGFVVLALGMAKLLYKFKVSTIAQIFDVAYKAPHLKKLASLLSIISLFMIFVGQLIASKKFLVSVGLDSDLIFMGFWAIVIVYTVVGGLQAIVAADMFQASFYIAIFLACFGYALSTSSLPIGDVYASGWNSETFTFGGEKFCGWLLMPLLFMVIEQDMGQKFFAAKSGRIAALAAAGAAFCIFCVCSIPIYFGVYSRSVGLEVPEGASVLMTAMMQNTTPILSALMGCSILAAIISTADSLLNAISSNLTQDFELPFAQNKVRMSRLFTAVIALAGIALSYSFHNVVDLLILSYELSISCLFMSVFVALFKPQGNVLSATLSIACGALGFILFRWMPIPIPKEIAALGLSAMGYAVGEIVVRWRAADTQTQVN